MKRVIVYSPFDDVKLADIRFLEEAAKLGSARLLLPTDDAIERSTGSKPKFPSVERKYFADSIRYLDDISVIDHDFTNDAVQAVTERSVVAAPADTWLVRESDDSPTKQSWCKSNHLEYRLISDETLAQLPKASKAPDNPQSDRKKIVITGSFDWFHTGHVRFFEEVAELGDVYAVVGHDANIRLLKGEHHPLFPELHRRYIVGSIKFVKLALISSGSGWMDGEPEFLKIKPDIYAVNEDGDKPEKKAFCERLGIEYRVLKRTPKAGLPKRSSTDLRGF